MILFLRIIFRIFPFFSCFLLAFGTEESVKVSLGSAQLLINTLLFDCSGFRVEIGENAEG